MATSLSMSIALIYYMYLYGEDEFTKNNEHNATRKQRRL